MLLHELISIRRALSAHGDDRLSPKLAYKISKFLYATSHDEEIFSDKMRDIIGEAAERDDSGELITAENGIKIDRDKLQLFNQKCAELNQIIADVPLIQFNMDDIDELKPTLNEMCILNGLIIE